jgi:hypothetical protein
MSEQPAPEPYDIAIARRQLAEDEAWVRIADGFSEIRFIKNNQIQEISSFLADWEAGQIVE